MAHALLGDSIPGTVQLYRPRSSHAQPHPRRGRSRSHRSSSMGSPHSRFERIIIPSGRVVMTTQNVFSVSISVDTRIESGRTAAEIPLHRASRHAAIDRVDGASVVRVRCRWHAPGLPIRQRSLNKGSPYVMEARWSEYLGAGRWRSVMSLTIFHLRRSRPGREFVAPLSSHTFRRHTARADAHMRISITL